MSTLGSVQAMLRRDLREAAQQLGEREARHLVDAYYALQGHRIKAQSQVRALNESEEPNAVLSWLYAQNETLEKEIKKALDDYSLTQEVGRWSRSITGIGPVLAAALLAHIDIEKAPTVGHIWRFAGLDPTVTWSKGEKRPWNASLKVVCWKIGESFVKVSGLETDVYGKVIMERKALEWERNFTGQLADQAQETLASKDLDKTTDAFAWYSASLTEENARMIMGATATARQGLAQRLAGEPGSGVSMLPPARIHARAQRYGVKLFLAHWQHVAFESRFGEPPPKPYVIEHLGHAHFIAPPNWPL